jgi:hypothetical protein
MDLRWRGHEVGEADRTEDDAEQYQQNGVLDRPK